MVSARLRIRLNGQGQDFANQIERPTDEDVAVTTRQGFGPLESCPGWAHGFSSSAVDSRELVGRDRVAAGTRRLGENNSVGTQGPERRQKRVRIAFAEHREDRNQSFRSDEAAQ